MTTASQSVFQKIASAQAFQGGSWIRDGRYVLQVKKIECGQKFSGNHFIVEFVVVSCERTEPFADPNPVGSLCSWVLALDKNLSAPGNAKTFILALLGYDGEVSVDDLVATIDEITGDKNPAKGMLIHDETFRKPTKAQMASKEADRSKLFLGHRWSNIKQTDEEIAARRAEMK